jgi:hypothetical protein
MKKAKKELREELQYIWDTKEEMPTSGLPLVRLCQIFLTVTVMLRYLIQTIHGMLLELRGFYCSDCERYDMIVLEERIELSPPDFKEMKLFPFEFELVPWCWVRCPGCGKEHWATRIG